MNTTVDFDYTIMVYGLADASKQYMAMRYIFVDKHDMRLYDAIDSAVNRLKTDPNITAIYSIDNQRGLYDMYNLSHRHPTIENCYVFKDYLERYGRFERIR